MPCRSTRALYFQCAVVSGEVVYAVQIQRAVVSGKDSGEVVCAVQIRRAVVCAVQIHRAEDGGQDNGQGVLILHCRCCI